MAGVTGRPGRHSTARMAISQTTQFKLREPRPILCSAWKAELLTAQVSPGQRSRFETEIRRFLRYCEVLSAPVTAPRSREYVSRVPLVATRPVAREALRWFFKAARATERAAELAAANGGAVHPSASVFPEFEPRVGIALGGTRRLRRATG